MSDPRSAPPSTQDPTLGSLVHDLTQQVPELVRSEVRLAQAELTEKGKRAGAGIGAFGAAGLVALYAVAALLATIVLLLALVLPAWAAALIVTLVLFAVAGAAAVVGKQQVDKIGPAKPEKAMEGLKADVATIKGEQP